MGIQADLSNSYAVNSYSNFLDIPQSYIYIVYVLLRQCIPNERQHNFIIDIKLTAIPRITYQ